jgi:hypothetical protein
MEQRRSKLLLQKANLIADRCGGHTQFACRAREIEVASGDLENMQRGEAGNPTHGEPSNFCLS